MRLVKTQDVQTFYLDDLEVLLSESLENFVRA